MPSTVEQISPSHVKLTVEIPFAELEPLVQKAYKEISESVQLPGFRKGKVPAALIDQRFGRGVVLQEAVNEALPGAYAAAIDEHNLVPLGQPEVEVTELKDGELVEFTAEVDVRPEFDLPDFDSIKVVVPDAMVDEADVDERIDRATRWWWTSLAAAMESRWTMRPPKTLPSLSVRVACLTA